MTITSGTSGIVTNSGTQYVSGTSGSVGSSSVPGGPVTTGAQFTNAGSYPYSATITPQTITAASGPVYPNDYPYVQANQGPTGTNIGPSLSSFLSGRTCRLQFDWEPARDGLQWFNNATQTGFIRLGQNFPYSQAGFPDGNTIISALGALSKVYNAVAGQPLDLVSIAWDPNNTTLQAYLAANPNYGSTTPKLLSSSMRADPAYLAYARSGKLLFQYVGQTSNDNDMWPALGWAYNSCFGGSSAAEIDFNEQFSGDPLTRVDMSDHFIDPSNSSDGSTATVTYGAGNQSGAPHSYACLIDWSAKNGTAKVTKWIDDVCVGITTQPGISGNKMWGPGYDLHWSFFEDVATSNLANPGNLPAHNYLHSWTVIEVDAAAIGTASGTNTKATAYITAVQNAGVTLTQAEQDALHTFANALDNFGYTATGRAPFHMYLMFGPAQKMGYIDFMNPTSGPTLAPAGTGLSWTQTGGFKGNGSGWLDMPINMSTAGWDATNFSFLTWFTGIAADTAHGGIIMAGASDPNPTSCRVLLVNAGTSFELGCASNTSSGHYLPGPNDTVQPGFLHIMNHTPVSGQPLSEHIVQCSKENIVQGEVWADCFQGFPTNDPRIALGNEGVLFMAFAPFWSNFEASVFRDTVLTPLMQAFTGEGTSNVSIVLNQTALTSTTETLTASASNLPTGTALVETVQITQNGTVLATATQNFTTLPTPPTAPTVAVTGETTTSLSGTITPPTSGDSPYTYRIYYEPAGTSGFKQLPDQSSTSFSITGLPAAANGQAYDVYAYAIDAVGQLSPVSNIVSASTTPAGTATTWDPNNKASGITLSSGNMEADASNGTYGQSPNYDSETVYSTSSRNSDVLYFEIKMKTASNDFAIGLAGSGCATDLSGGLGGTAGTGGKTCGYYPVSPAQSVWIAGVEVLAPTGTPTADTSGAVLRCVANLNTKKAWFQSPAMVATYGAGAWNCSTSANPSTGAGGIDISGLTFPVKIAFNEMEAGSAVLNTGGSAWADSLPSGASAWDSSGATVTVPGAPGTPTASAETSSSITIGWTAPTTGSAATSYQPRWSTSSSGPWTLGSSTTALSTTITGLAAGTLIYFEVAGSNSAGQGAFSAAGSATTAQTTPVPGAVTGFAATSETATSITYGWNAATGATGYVIETSTDGVNWVQPGTTEGNVTTATLPNLHSGTQYWARIVGTNSGGQGPWATTGPNSTTPATGVPGQVAAPTLTPLTANSMRVSWNSVSGATGYYIKFMQVFDSGYTVYGPFTSSPHTFTGLQESTVHNCQVYAYNSSGNGTPSSTVQQSTLRDFLYNPGEDDGFWLRVLSSNCQWLLSGPQVTLMRNGSNGSPTARVNTQDTTGWNPAWYIGQTTDVSVVVDDQTGNPKTVKLPLGATCEQPAGDNSIGGVTIGDHYMAWSAYQANIDGSTTNAIKNGSTITCSQFATVDASGAYMEDATTGFPGAMNVAGGITDYDLMRMSQDPNWFPMHTLQLFCDSSQVNNSGKYWPLNIIDTSLPNNPSGLNQGFFIGIPSNVAMPSGLSRGGQALFHTLQKFGGWMYNVSGEGCINFFAWPDPTKSTYQAHLALADQMDSDASTIIALCGILTNQTSPATRKGGTPAAFPQYTPPNGDLNPTGNANIAPSSNGFGWYCTGANMTYNATPGNAANPT